MQKWEYCAVGPIRGGGEGEYPALVQFTEAGRRVTRIGKTRQTSEPDVLAQVISRLGNEGWEMVACGNVGERLHMLYFKRPKAG